MTLTTQSLSKYVIRAGAVLVVALGASACSSIPDWVDPTTWIGGNDQPSNASDTADNGQSPDLSTIPDKPNAPSTPDEQKQVSDTLAADRSQAQYSGDALRGGTEPAAAPPPTTAPPPTDELASDDSSDSQPKPAAPPQPPAVPAAGPGTLPAENTAAESATPAAAPEAAANTEVASVAPAPSAPGGGEPAVPASGPTVPTAGPLGFQPSSAPPLDSSVAQFVSPSIIARYRETGTVGGQPAVGSNQDQSAGSRHHRKSHRSTTGGADGMNGTVVADLGPQQGGTAVSSAVSAMTGAPAAIVYFPHDTTVLDSEAKTKIRAAAKAFLAQGGQGYVRVIGHSSSGTGTMSSARRLVWNFERSQARANAVARLLIKEGVPAEKVLVQAAGEDDAAASAQQGGNAGRRAEIYFQS